MFSIDAEKANDVTVLRCSGRMVRGNAIAALKNAVMSERGARIVVLDLSEVQVLDAGGLAALLTLFQWTHDRDIQFKLVNPAPFVLEILQRTRLDRVFDISSLQDALVVLAGAPPHAWKYAACS